MKYVISIGRQYGAGGYAVADYLSNKLGIKVYDKELITMAAKDSGINPDAFKGVDEKRHNSFLFGLFHSFMLSSDASFNSSILTNENLFKIQSDVIEQIASEESCIIIGRCADYILRERENIHTVFLTADLDSRIERIVSRNQVSIDKATSLIEQTDQSRAKYYEFYTMKKWGAAESYDLCINTSRHGVEKTGDYIIDFFNLK